MERQGDHHIPRQIQSAFSIGWVRGGVPKPFAKAATGCIIAGSAVAAASRCVFQLAIMCRLRACEAVPAAGDRPMGRSHRG